MINILSTRKRDNGLIHAEVEWHETINEEVVDVWPWAVGNIPGDVDPETWCNLPKNYERIANDAARKYVMQDGEWDYASPIDKDALIASLVARLDALEAV